MHTKHQGSVHGTADEDGLVLDTIGIVAGTEDLVLRDKAHGDTLDLISEGSAWRKHTGLNFKGLQRLK